MYDEMFAQIETFHAALKLDITDDVYRRFLTVLRAIRKVQLGSVSETVENVCALVDNLQCR